MEDLHLPVTMREVGRPDFATASEEEICEWIAAQTGDPVAEIRSKRAAAFERRRSEVAELERIYVES